MDEPQAPAENPSVAEDSSALASPASQPSDAAITSAAEGQTSEPAVQETDVQEPSSEGTAQAAPVEQPAPTEPERQPRPAQRRIQELVQQNKQLKERLVSGPIPQQLPQAPKLSDLVQGRESLDPAELDQLGQQVYEQGAQVAKGTTGLEVAQLRQEMVIRDAINETEKQAAQLSSEFNELNPNSSDYNPALDAKIAARYQREVVKPNPLNPQQRIFDPSVKLADIAKEEVDFYREATEYGKAQTSAALASSADQAAITPTSATPAPDKSFESMSLPEQEAYLRSKGHDI